MTDTPCWRLISRMLGEKGLDTVGAEPAAVDIGEQRTCAAARRFLEPFLDCAPRVRSQRRAPFLSSFANASHMRAGAEMDGIPVEADQLAKAQAGLCRERYRPSRRCAWCHGSRVAVAVRSPIGSRRTGEARWQGCVGRYGPPDVRSHGCRRAPERSWRSS